MHYDIHKARTLLSSKMDDVRALKRMVSETKETLELKRRQRLIQEIKNAAKYNGDEKCEEVEQPKTKVIKEK
jgi:hypothetical protein